MNPLPQGHGQNMMDMIKTQFMTITMMKSVNGQTDHGSSMMGMLYIFILTGMIDFFCKTVYPFVSMRVKEYYTEKINTSTLLKEMSSSKDNVKTSSITLLIKISDHANVYGQALLDYITNNNNTKHVIYKKQNFILNQTDVIDISDGLFVILKENKLMESSDKSSSTSTSTSTSPDIEQHVELFSYTKTIHQLRSFLNKIAYDYELKMKNKLGDHIYYFNQHPVNLPVNMKGQKDYSKLPSTCTFTMKKFQTNRKFSNLFGPEIEIVKKRVQFFIENKKWYDEKGIPYTLGLLLSGQAGAGKTSSIKCLANETSRHIININLNNDISKVQFENLFFNEVISVLNISTGQTEKYSIPLDQRIYVLEDIDCQSDLVMERNIKSELIDPDKEKEKNPAFLEGIEKLDLSFLLNILDGVLEIPGRIVIMTSNFIDKLDHALIRPGRIDIIADFKKCLNVTLIEMIEFFYDIVLSPSEKTRIHALEEYKISPAEMGKIMFENFNDHTNVIVELEKIMVKDMLECIETEDEDEHILKLENITLEKDTVDSDSDSLETLESNHSTKSMDSTKLEAVEPVKPNDPIFQKIIDENKNEKKENTVPLKEDLGVYSYHRKGHIKCVDEYNALCKIKSKEFFESGFTEAVDSMKIKMDPNEYDKIKLMDPYNLESEVGSLLEPSEPSILSDF